MKRPAVSEIPEGDSFEIPALAVPLAVSLSWTSAPIWRRVQAYPREELTMTDGPTDPSPIPPPPGTIPEDEQPTVGPDPAAEASTFLYRSTTGAAPPARIGPYDIRHEIGHGGQGTVYLGVTVDGPIQRRVAVKVLRLGLDDAMNREIHQRFLLERQLLACLNHPNIARLFDGGMTDDGRPWFAMEYIEGVPITTYCDQNELSIDDRLELFCTVCDAVRFAHANLIIHRDLKPDHILVTADGVPKLMDFGLAKLLNPDLFVAGGNATMPWLRLMTPEYASPEQILREPVSTASDVYSLGVVLYELLAGRRPYLMDRRLAGEFERIIREVVPERPSNAVSRPVEDVDELTSPEDASTRSRTSRHVRSTRRSTRPDQLRRRLSGDLDNIVMTSLRKEPARRYPTVDEFRNDLRRHLDGRPIVARPSSVPYLAHKFVRRHRAGVTIAALAAVAATLGVVAAFSVQRNAAMQARAEASVSRADLVRQSADSLARRHAQLRRFLEGFPDRIGEVDDAIAKLAGSMEARERLNAMAARSVEVMLTDDDGLVDDPAMALDVARAWTMLASFRFSRRNPSEGRVDEAAACAERAEGALAAPAALPDDHPLRDEALRAELQVLRLRGDIAKERRLRDEQEAIFTESLRVAELIRRRAVDGDFTAARAVAAEHLNLGKTLLTRRELTRAGTHLRRSMELRRQHLDRFGTGTDDRAELARRDASVGYAALGLLAYREDRLAAAAAAYLDCLDLREGLLAENPTMNRERRDVAVARRHLGDVHIALFAAHSTPADVAAAAAHYVAAHDVFVDLHALETRDDRTRDDVLDMVTRLGMAVRLAPDDPATTTRLAQLLIWVYDQIDRAGFGPDGPGIPTSDAVATVNAARRLAACGDGTIAADTRQSCLDRAALLCEKLAVLPPDHPQRDAASRACAALAETLAESR